LSLGKLCSSIEEEARREGGTARIAQLRSAADRAIAAARSSPHARAA
jgi:hypothetical protein